MSKKRNKPGPGFACRRPGTPQFKKKQYRVFLRDAGLYDTIGIDHGRGDDVTLYEVRFGAYGVVIAREPTDGEWRKAVEATWAVVEDEEAPDGYSILPVPK